MEITILRTKKDMGKRKRFIMSVLPYPTPREDYRRIGVYAPRSRKEAVCVGFIDTYGNSDGNDREHGLKLITKAFQCETKDVILRTGVNLSEYKIMEN